MLGRRILNTEGQLGGKDAMEYLVPQELGAVAVELWRQPLDHALKAAPQGRRNAVPAKKGVRHKIRGRTGSWTTHQEQRSNKGHRV